MPPIYANGHISATGDPIHFMFGSRVGFSGSADRMAPFPVTSNPSWRQKLSWIISNGHISATAHSIHLYSAHRAVIFAIAQLSCFGVFVHVCALCSYISLIICYTIATFFYALMSRAGDDLRCEWPNHLARAMESAQCKKVPQSYNIVTDDAFILLHHIMTLT